MTLKGTRIKIWKSANIFVFMWKWYARDFTLKHLLLFEICAHEICEKFFCKHSETIEYVKKLAYFLKNYKLHEQITRESLGLRQQNFQDIVFIWTQTYREIFASVLKYLKGNYL